MPEQYICFNSRDKNYAFMNIRSGSETADSSLNLYVRLQYILAVQTDILYVRVGSVPEVQWNLI